MSHFSSVSLPILPEHLGGKHAQTPDSSLLCSVRPSTHAHSGLHEVDLLPKISVDRGTTGVWSSLRPGPLRLRKAAWGDGVSPACVPFPEWQETQKAAWHGFYTPGLCESLGQSIRGHPVSRLEHGPGCTSRLLITGWYILCTSGRYCEKYR